MTDSSEKGLRSLYESLQEIDDTDPNKTDDKKLDYKCNECGYTVEAAHELKNTECPECGGVLDLKKAPEDTEDDLKSKAKGTTVNKKAGKPVTNEDDDNLDDDSDDDESLGEDAPSTKDAGYVYQDEDGNLYHSDVEIASYVDPKTGKVQKVFSYGKGAGLGKATKQPAAVVSGMKGESVRLRRLMRENRRLRQGLKRSKLTESAGNFFKVGSVDASGIHIYDISDETDSIDPLIDNLDETEDGLGFVDSHGNSFYLGEDLTQYLEELHEEYLDQFEDEPDLAKEFDDDMKKLISKIDDGDLYVVVVNQYGEPDVNKLKKQVQSDLKGENESAKISNLMRENRKLRRSLRSRVNESGENITAKKLGSIDSYKLTIYQIDGIKDLSIYSDTPTYPGLSLGDHDEYKLRDTDKMVEWLETISDDLKDDGNSDEAKNVDKLTDKVANGGSHLYVTLSNRYSELTSNQVVDFITREVELRDPKDESARLRRLMRENRKLRNNLKRSSSNESASVKGLHRLQK